MNKDIRAIPTIYRSRRYRSRLEARWAVMFDLLKWKYEYEPYDLDGWIPDFALFGDEEILVEAKPHGLRERFTEKEIEKIRRATEHDEKRYNDVLLLGSTIQMEYVRQCGCKVWTLGSLMIYIGGYPPLIEEAILSHYDGKTWGFYPPSDKIERITGLGHNYPNEHDTRPYPKFYEVLDLWNEAGNTVQWRPPE